jgi:hypothetical protein
MSTPTDLNTFLRGDEDSVLTVLLRKYDDGPGDSSTGPDDDGKHPWIGPFECWCKYWSEGATAPEKVSEFTVASLDAFDAHAVIGRIESDITDELGYAPIGLIKVQFWESGQGSTPIVRKQATLTAGHAGQRDQERDRNLRRINHLERQQTAAMDILQRNNAEAFTLLASTSDKLAQVAGMRGTTGSASDLSSLATLAGLGVVFLLYPSLKKMLRLPSDASVDEVMQASRTALAGVMKGVSGDGDGEPTPPQIPDLAKSGAGDDDDGDGDDERSATDVMMGTLRAEPGLLAVLMASVQSDPKLGPEATRLVKLAAAMTGE